VSFDEDDVRIQEKTCKLVTEMCVK